MFWCPASVNYELQPPLPISVMLLFQEQVILLLKYCILYTLICFDTALMATTSTTCNSFVACEHHNIFTLRKYFTYLLDYLATTTLTGRKCFTHNAI
jgi:hypothetical protein